MQTDYAQTLFEAIADSAVLIDKSGKIVDWNPGSATLFGYSKKETIGRSLNLIYGQNQPFLKILQDILPKQKKWSTEIPFIRKNGTKGFCRVIINTLTHPSAPHKAVALVTHHNLSALKNSETESIQLTHRLASELHYALNSLYAINTLLFKQIIACENLEKTLRESELRFHLLAENATDIISRHSPEGAYLYVSPTTKNLTGYTSEELIGRSAYKFLHHDDVAKLKKVFRQRKENSSNQTITYRIRRKDGEYRWFESTFRIIRDEETNNIREIQSASRDVTDHVFDKKARLRGQQLAHVFRLSTMEEMASGMAHEISQPLAAIVNYTQGCVRYLQSNQLEPPQLIDIMQKAVSQAERAGEVIQRLKHFFCKGQLFKTPCKVNGLIRETIGLIRSEINNSKTKMDCVLTKNLPIISADRIQLQQVILNLINNAIEAMHEVDARERRIQIITKTNQDNKLEFTVKDSGPGFLKENINNVFEPFFTTKAHGRGMGLAICRSIIEAHGGQFSINPNTHNESWIRFTLPIREEIPV